VSLAARASTGSRPGAHRRESLRSEPVRVVHAAGAFARCPIPGFWGSTRWARWQQRRAARLKAGETFATVIGMGRQSEGGYAESTVHFTQVWGVLSNLLWERLGARPKMLGTPGAPSSELCASNGVSGGYCRLSELRSLPCLPYAGEPLRLRTPEPKRYRQTL
jgi:hypothetical protein